ncbi:hypothetical protein GJ496_007474 [Pomphorhynchus laevis]|nr:hypothetical protein GJ496_007474 [Pomphorhynchus laevis]
MTIIPWYGDVFMQLRLKQLPDPPWWNRKDYSWRNYEQFFSNLNPTDWKLHDLYRILRLENRRFLASVDDIQKSYRIIARKYHPDKKPGSDKNYPCVIKAAEILLNSATRRAFDSIDPLFDDIIPNEIEVKSLMESHPNDQNLFFDIFRPVFDRNARWSVRQPVPCIGDWYTPDDIVDYFYKFWLDFDSWREYSHLDKEDKSQGQDRYIRKEIEKTNRRERQKLKLEELTRISNLAEIARSLDPRLKLRQQQAQAEKLRKQEERRQAKIVKEKQEQERIKRERQEQMESLRKQADKDTEIQKLVVELSRQQSQFRQIAIKAFPDQERAIDRYIQFNWPTDQEEKILKSTEATEQLSKLNLKLESIPEEERRNEISKIIKLVKKKIALVNAWTVDELELLVKCIRLFPPGTKNRWDTIHRYMLDHGMDKAKSEKDVMEKARRLKEGERFKINGILESKKAPSTSTSITKAIPWSADEQKLLENGLRQFPASDVNRWDNIAALMTNRTKEECLLRFQHIVAMLKQKKSNEKK